MRMDIISMALVGGTLYPIDDLGVARFCRLSRQVWLGRIDNQDACIWGLIPPSLLSEEAYIWLHTWEIAEQHQFVLARRSQDVVKNMLYEYPRLVGHCAASDERAQHWLKWLGAKFGYPDGKLIPFAIERK